jgi:tetratricopeptide (TPR) repeat protein
MKPLEPPITHQVRAAQGWFELGNHLEATAELDSIPTALRAHPDVLEVRMHIYAKEEKWAQCAHIAEALIVFAPGRTSGWVHRSYALHELKRTAAALKALLPAAKRFPRAAIIHYNLACYTCEMGDWEDAWEWLKQAFAVGDAKELKLMALDDADLEPLWEKIRSSLPSERTFTKISLGHRVLRES